MGTKNIKLFGRSSGDSSVGIPSIDFEIDTGLWEMDEQTRKWFANTVIPAIWELHDNGDVDWVFSDEWDELAEDDQWAFTRRYTWTMNNKKEPAVK